jgi:hypothetical protein
LTIRALELPDWLIMSGAVYQRVLNALTERAPDYEVRDHDLGYFDASDISYEAEDVVIRWVAAAFDEQLRSVVEARNFDHLLRFRAPLTAIASAFRNAEESEPARLPEAWADPRNSLMRRRRKRRGGGRRVRRLPNSRAATMWARARFRG